jgi:uncharacterized delta-60 repeat protein
MRRLALAAAASLSAAPVPVLPAGASAAGVYPPAPGVRMLGFGKADAHGGEVIRLRSGKLLVAGVRDSLAQRPAARWAIRRLSSKGRPDKKYGTRYLFAGKGDFADVFALRRLLSGKILAVGEAGPGGQTQVALARFKADGTLDRTFGPAHTGTALLPRVQDIQQEGHGAAELADGSLLIAGQYSDHNVSPEGLVAHVSANGVLIGRTHVADPGMMWTPYTDALARPGGALTAGGGLSCDDCGSRREFTVLDAYGPDLKPMPDWATGGKQVVEAEPFTEGQTPQQHLAARPGGGAVVAYTDGRFRWKLRAFDAHGKPVPGFGVTLFPDKKAKDGQINGIVRRARGGYVAVGQASEKGNRYGAALIAVAVTKAGKLDKHFGRGGVKVLSSPVLGVGWGETDTVVEQPGGMLVISGNAQELGGRFAFDNAVVRLKKSGAVDRSFGR